MSALVIVLSSVGLAPNSDNARRSREAVLKEDLFRIRDAIDQYYADKNKYPASLQDLLNAGYLREIPKDPITESAATWQAVNVEPGSNNAAADPGIYDVKSGSEKTAMYGTKYADWE